MARTLTAGVKPPPRRKEIDCADVVAGLWITLGHLWMKGQRYGKLVNAMRDTKEKLADPALRDHPKRGAAEDRMEGWRIELRLLEGQKEPFRRGLEGQWDALPERIHRFLRDSGGWPEGKDGREMANGLWRYAIEGKPFPGGECPF